MEQVITFGCRLNSFESQVIKENLKKSKLDNVIVFNTCAVTKEAERQAIQKIRNIRKKYPDKKILVTGCAAQINPDKYAAMKEIDKVLGNEDKFISNNYLISNKESSSVVVSDIMSVKETAAHLVQGFENKTRAFIQIQNGCNHRCTFCSIPYGRGNSRSVPIGVIVKQLEVLAAQDYKEVVFTGVDISDYGLDLPGKPTLGQMLKRILKLVPKISRIRLSSIDVAEIDNDLFDLIKYEQRFMPHLHISLQAGDNMILKRMKRRHTREQVIEFCHKVRQYRANAAFGADIIAGFPTETDEMFKNTLNLVHEAKIQYLHVFPYSERENTPAARMPQVDKKLRKERARILREAGDRELYDFSIDNLNRNVTALVENDQTGRSENFLKLYFNNKVKTSSLIEAKIIGFQDNKLIAEVV